MLVDNNADLKNKFKILELIKSHFSYTDESLKLFKYRLFYEPLIAREFESFIKDSKDLRKRIKLDDKQMEKLDGGWKLFKQKFSSFVKESKITYDDFKKNKLKKDKQEIKLKKALDIFYVKHPTIALDDGFLSTDFTYAIVKVGKSYCFTAIPVFAGFSCNSCGKNCKKKDFNAYLTFMKSKEKEITKISDDARALVMNSIRIGMERVGTRKIPATNLEMVFSLNFADWFLCSAGEKWSSCISLDSNYEKSYWTGLPGLIGDRNRALVYITDGVKKNYHGIKVDRVLSRSWLTIMRSKDEKTKNQVFFNMVKEYPINLGLDEIFESNFGLKITPFQKLPKKYVGRYRIELFWHKVSGGKFYNSIYFDNFKVTIANKNLAQHFEKGTFGVLSDGSGSSCYLKTKDKIVEENEGFYYDGGLSRLIKGKVWGSSKKKLLKEISYFFNTENVFNFDEDDGYEDYDDYEDYDEF